MVQNIGLDLKSNYKIDDLIKIMALLRSENGCPWDKEQNHKSIRGNLLEEAYEVADAIDLSDDTALCEELGDLLLQVVFHSRMAEEENSFDFDKVADGICKKLILRHPHIFGDVKVNSTSQVLDNWEKIKHIEKNQTTVSETLESVPKAFPALMRAAKVQKRASKAGFDWPSVSGALDKIYEETEELKEAVKSSNQEMINDELGDLLFSVVNVSRFTHSDAEDSLQNATEKFISRFKKVEELAAQRGIDMAESSIEELDKLWDEAKNSVR